MAKKTTKKTAAAQARSAGGARKTSAASARPSAARSVSGASKSGSVKASAAAAPASTKKTVSAKRARPAPAKVAAPPVSEPEADEVEEIEEEMSEAKESLAAAEAGRVLSGDGAKPVGELGDDLVSGKKSVAASAARVLDEIVSSSPESVVPIIDRYVAAIGGADKRPAQSAAKALPVMARIAPARVARHLAKLKAAFGQATEPGRDGLVRTFAGLCTASVAYQRRLEDVLNQALSEADAKTLITWTEVVLPALKGEPHARARATVEGRLNRIPKASAQRIADFLGIKLRLRY